MKTTTRNYIYAISLVLFACTCWGQPSYHGDLFSAPSAVESNKSITRIWNNKAQITYIEDIEYDPFDASTIVSSTAKFVYFDPLENFYKVAEFDNSHWPRITDFEILDDTLYFCGYANVAASSANPYYIGFIGYFCIPRLFDGTDVIHAFTFNQQRLSLLPSDPSYDPSVSDIVYINEPCKLEVYKAGNGIHLICIGGWSHTRNTLFSAGSFVADVVHSFATNDWWYYVHLNSGVEKFCDIAVTDNYVVTVAAKDGYQALYMRVYTKPWQVGLNPADPGRDPSIFDRTHRTPPYQSYYFTWEDDPYQSKVEYPNVIHTNGDTFAVSYFTYAWNDGHEYGAVVKVLDIADMLHLASNSEGGGGVPVIVDPPEAPLAPIGPGDPGTNPDPFPPSPSNTPDTVRFHYNRYIDLQNHDWYTGPIDQVMDWSIRSMVYDSAKRCIVLLERDSYAPGLLSDNFSLDAFRIHSPTAPVERHHLYEPDRPLYSLSGGLNAGEFCLSGNSGPAVGDGLLLGFVRLECNLCVEQYESLPTRYHHGRMDDIVGRPNHFPAFDSRRFLPTAAGIVSAAFSPTVLNVNICIKYIEDLCHP